MMLGNGVIIVGAGPSGLSVAAGLKKQGVPYIILEKDDCIGSLWQKRTYNNINLQVPKKFCQLPYLCFPSDYPMYPTKYQFHDYLESYAKYFNINPRFNECVHDAKYDKTCGLWRLSVLRTIGGLTSEVNYASKWLVVATGDNAEKIVPDIEGLKEFRGNVVYACDYKDGKEFEGKNVLVVGCGNSGMDIALDLALHKAYPSMVVRSEVHILPKNIYGVSTFTVVNYMKKLIPIWMADMILIALCWLIFGNIAKYGLKRPLMGPLKHKSTTGKSPVLEHGTLQYVRSGEIKVVPGIKKIYSREVELVNGEILGIDSLVLATGYRSNVNSWLKENELFSKNGTPVERFPNGWKGKNGIYAVGFAKDGIITATFHAIRISEDIGKLWKEETTY